MSALEGEETTTDKKDDANQKDQLDEVLALESIYSATPEYFSYNVDKDCKVSGSITIVLPKIDKEIVVYADKKSIHINHLPPLLLRFSFPSDYPSYSMPQFSLQTIWLDSTEMLRLSNILTNSWTDFRGMPILFTWVEMLKEEAMQIIVSHPIINLAEISAKENSPNDALELLKTFTEYEEQAVQTEFESNWYDCEVCFSSSSGKECIRFMFCGHIFCTDCVSSYYHQKLKDNVVPQFECLSEGCDSAATQVQIRQVLTVKEFEIYEQRLLEGTLDLMADVFICPRLSCQAPVIADDIQSSNGSSLASCSLCHYSFCILCRKTYHGIEPCRLSSEVRDKLLQQLETATEPQREQIYKRFGGRKQFERQIEAMKSERWIDANSKPCPNCRANIEKNNGCNKMTCSKCKNHFCWLCGMLLDQKDPYRHFNMAGSKSCFNRLFEGLQDDDDWFLGSSDSDGDE